MKSIEVSVINHAVHTGTEMANMLAKLTQKGHKVSSIADLLELMSESTRIPKSVVEKNHGSIIRHAPVSIGIVGASRRVLAQLRTHHVGITWVSASMQYSDYSDDAAFVVPYEILEAGNHAIAHYKTLCAENLQIYGKFADLYDNDTAGYLMNHGLRNVLVGTGNIEAWRNLVALRACKRNTTETAYVASLIWDSLRHEIHDGETMMHMAGPGCMRGFCPEYNMSCGKPIDPKTTVEEYIEMQWPLLAGELE